MIKLSYSDDTSRVQFIVGNKVVNHIKASKPKGHNIDKSQDSVKNSRNNHAISEDKSDSLIDYRPESIRYADDENSKKLKVISIFFDFLFMMLFI